MREDRKKVRGRRIKRRRRHQRPRNDDTVIDIGKKGKGKGKKKEGKQRTSLVLGRRGMDKLYCKCKKGQGIIIKGEGK